MFSDGSKNAKFMGHWKTQSWDRKIHKTFTLWGKHRDNIKYMEKHSFHSCPYTEHICCLNVCITWWIILGRSCQIFPKAFLPIGEGAQITNMQIAAPLHTAEEHMQHMGSFTLVQPFVLSHPLGFFAADLSADHLYTNSPNQKSLQLSHSQQICCNVVMHNWWGERKKEKVKKEKNFAITQPALPNPKFFLKPWFSWVFSYSTGCSFVQFWQIQGAKTVELKARKKVLKSCETQRIRAKY